MTRKTRSTRSIVSASPTPKARTRRPAPPVSDTDALYHAREDDIRRRIAAIDEPLFTTDADPAALWKAYLSPIPKAERAYYTCNSCRHFIERFGGLVTIDPVTGATIPLLWWPLPGGLDVSNLDVLVRRAKVTGVFRWNVGVWGTPENESPTGVRWTHLSGRPSHRYAHALKSPSEQMAELREDFGILSRSLADYSIEVVREAVRVLKSGALTRSEKAEGIAMWFLLLHEQLAHYVKQPKNTRRQNMIWHAVATAPPGFAHVRTTVLSTLLDDIVGGFSFDTVALRWSEKLHPLSYQRPKAAPKAGNVDRAEKLVEQLGYAPSLLRRFATLDDVLEKLWVPRAARRSPTTGVFSGLRRSSPTSPAMQLPGGAITWAKFSRDVLPAATKVEIHAPSRGAYYGLVTAADPTAMPILQWDGLVAHDRNPVNWYFYNGGSVPSQWGLRCGWTPVAAIFLAPHQWQMPGAFTHQGKQIHFAIADAQDQGRSGLALFPEILKSELREIRATIEAFSRQGVIAGRETGNANGLAFNDRSPVTVRVTTGPGQTTQYTIDRWE